MGAYATFDRGAHWTHARRQPAARAGLRSGLSGKRTARWCWARTAAASGCWTISSRWRSSLAEVAERRRHICSPYRRRITRLIYAGQFWFGAGEFFAPNPQHGALITYYLPKQEGGTEIAISDAVGELVRTLHGPGQAGLNRIAWDLRRAPAAGGIGPKVLPGAYTVTIAPAAGPPLKTSVTVLPEPGFPISDGDRKTRYRSVMSAYTLQQQLLPVRDAAQSLATSLGLMRLSLSATQAIAPRPRWERRRKWRRRCRAFRER